MGRVLAVCGLPGSGKGEFASVMERNGIPILSMGDMVRAEVSRLNIEESPGIFGEIAAQLRAEFGDDVEADDGGSGDENDKSRVGAASCVRDAELGALRACHSNAEQLAANLPEKTPANNSAANAPWDLF